jgi:hypothetical protein
MTTLPALSHIGNVATLSALLLIAPGVIAQSDPGATNLLTPVVSVLAADPQASEAGPDKGAFLIRRAGSTNTALRVFYQITGTATPGSDYEPLDLSVLLPAGTAAAELRVSPIDDPEIESSETVLLRLVNSPLVGPQDYYRIGSPSNAVVNIADNDRPQDTNESPLVEIVAPQYGEVFPTGTDILIAARASDVDGFVATVEFFAGTNGLGVTTNNPLSMSPVNPFQLIWSNAPPGSYLLTARATDDDGATTISPAIRITVGDRFEPTVVNIAATDPQGSEIPEVPPGQERPQLFDPALFTISRSGNTNLDLEVYYRVSGTASNGVDYSRLSGIATIPAGARAAQIEVAPIDDLLVEGIESVIIAIEPIACIAIFPPPPGCYQIGPSGHASAWLRDDDTKPANIPPNAEITAPPDGAVYPAPTDIAVRAVTIDVDGYANVVEFFDGTNRVGQTAIYFIQAPPPGEPIEFEFLWRNVGYGEHVLTARARDDRGAFGTSAPVRIRVGETPPPVPIVSIVARDGFAAEGTNPAGPNTATFLVQRSESTSTTLNVSYAVSGMASNGVDYEPLSGTVTIAAGERSARIIIAPIDDHLTEKPETVVLALTAQPASGPINSPAYIIGIPDRAAAVIVDDDWNRLPSICLPDRLFHLCLPATNGFCYRIDASTNLLQWVPICTNVVADGAVQFVDPDACELPRRFYRLTPEPYPSQD